jgi:hypothetical protein
MNVVLIGGGKAAVILLNFFAAQKGINVIGISDPKEDAPGVVRARSLGIATTTKTGELIARPDAKIIIELTGNSKVRAALLERLRPDQDIMSANCAKIMCDMIVAQASHDATVATSVSDQFKASIGRLQTANENMNIAYENVEKLLREAGLVTLNAKIESARAGQAGAAFAIVVDRMHEMLNSIKEAMGKISTASSEGRQTLASLESARDQLAEKFRLALPLPRK